MGGIVGTGWALQAWPWAQTFIGQPVPRHCTALCALLTLAWLRHVFNKRGSQLSSQMAFRSLRLGLTGHKGDSLYSGSDLEFGLSFTEFIKYMLIFLFNEILWFSDTPSECGLFCAVKCLLSMIKYIQPAFLELLRLIQREGITFCFLVWFLLNLCLLYLLGPYKFITTCVSK